LAQSVNALDNSNQTNNIFHSSARSTAASSILTFNLDYIIPQFSNSAGNQTIAAADNFPILGNCAMAIF